MAWLKTSIDISLSCLPLVIRRQELASRVAPSEAHGHGLFVRKGLTPPASATGAPCIMGSSASITARIGILP